jgi:hypothetical protein
MAVAMIGVDPHKASHTAVAIGPAEEPLGQVRVRASAVQAERLLGWAQAWPERAWAVEDAGGIGHLLARQLLSAGERVLDVPAKLVARVRLLATGDINKNDPGDARPVAVAALRSAQVREVRRDDHAAVLKVWTRALPGPGPAPHPGGLPAAPGAVRADPRRRRQGDHRGPGRSWPRSRQRGRCRRPAGSSPPSSPGICAAPASGSARRERRSLRRSGRPAPA